MELQENRIFLRDIREEDISDYIRWYTVDTEWTDWDAPWESIASVNLDELTASLRKRISHASLPRRRMEIGLDSGEHIGWVSSYPINGDLAKLAVGINIPSSEQRGQGVGRLALGCWLRYLFEAHGCSGLYTQTWSGNVRMIKLAEKLGFYEVNRTIGIREVRGNVYDALTFEISRDRINM